MKSLIENKHELSLEIVISKTKQFLESKWFIFLLGLITIGCWLMNVVYLPYIILCLLILIMTIVKAEAVSIIALIMLYLAGNSSGKVETSGAGFIITVITAILAVGGVLFRFSQNFKDNVKKIFTNKVIIALLILVGTMLISIINSPVKVHSLALTGIFALNVVVSVIVLLAVPNTIKSRDLLALSIIVFMYVVAFEFGINIIKASNEAGSLWKKIIQKKITIGWMMGNHFVIIINMALVMCGYFFIKRNDLKSRILILFSLIIGLTAEVLTMSRGGYLGLMACAIGIFVTILIRSKNKRNIFIALTFAVITFLIILFVLWKVDLFDKIFEQFKKLGVNENGRRPIWKLSWGLFKHNWFIGTGWGSSGYYIKTELNGWVVNYHNYFFQASTCGILGIGALGLYIYTILKTTIKNKTFSICTFVIVLMFLTHGLMDTVIYSKEWMLVLSCLIIASGNHLQSFMQANTKEREEYICAE